MGIKNYKMKNIWLLQSNGFKSSYLYEIAFTLDSYKIDYKDFGVVGDSITNLEKILVPEHRDVNFITRGGTKLLSILEKLKLNNRDLSYLNNKLPKEIIDESEFWIDKLMKSIDYNIENFDQVNYSKLNLPLLNSDARYIDYSSIKNYEFAEDKFIKPSRDLKSFNGGVIYAGETLQNYFMRTGGSSSNVKNEKIVVSDIKKIYSEYRFFMYKNEILACSRYMLNSSVEPDAFVPDYFKEKAIEYSKLYQPADLFVMDLAETDSGIKIVEYNCWNASGVYKCNLRDLLFRVNMIKS